MRAPIHSIKHYFGTPAVGVASGAEAGVNLINTIAKGASRSASNMVEEGAIVKAVYAEYWVQADDILNTVILSVNSC